LKNSLVALSLVSLLSVCSVACQNTPDAGGEGGAEPTPPAFPANPGQPGYSGATMSCADREKVVQACNLVTTREVNLESGASALYDPTPACQDALLSTFAFDSTWKTDSAKEAREQMLRGLHALLFFPMLHPKDLTFIFEGSPEIFTSEWTIDYGSREIPASHEFVVTRTHVNEGALDWVYGELTSITLDGKLDGTTHMETVPQSGALSVSKLWLKNPATYARSGTSWMASRYIVARSILHEMRHAAGAFTHEGCDNYFGNEKQCDEVLMASSYGVGAQTGQALVLGAMYARVDGDPEGKPIESPTVIKSLFLDNCEHALTKVNSVGKWVKENGAQGLCYDPTQDFVGDGMKLRPEPKADLSRVTAKAGAWTCAMSGNGVVSPKD
jgi:hypothetical protein